MGRRAARVAIAVAVAALSTACGTTVSTVSRPTAAVSGNDELSVPSTGLSTTAANAGRSASGGTTAGGLGSVSGTGTGNQPTSGGSAPITAPPTLATTPTGQLVVPVGVVYLKGLDQAYKAASGGKSNTTDSHADFEAVIKHLNAVPGSQVILRPDYYTVDASSTQSQADQLQAACAHFTSDVHVSLVVSYSAGAEGAFAKCLQQHAVPIIDGSSAAIVGESIERTVPDLWQPSQLTLDRVGSLEASYLLRNHWVDKRWPSAARCAAVSQPRVGVVTFDRPDWRAAYNSAVAPTFKAAGHPVFDVDFVAVSGSTAEQLAQASSAAQSAVLKFSSDCIDHVAFVGNVALDYLFMNIAQQQGYNPRYGLSSLEAPPVIVQNLAQATPQLHGAIGPGWTPYSDVDMAQLDAAAKAPAAECMAILKSAAAEPTDNNSAGLAMPACEGPMFAVAVLQRWLAGGRAGSLLDVVNGLGTSYHPVGTFAATIDPTYHDGASEFRGFAYVDSCTCFKYVTGLQRI
jgi:hypothetical protein